MCLRCDVGRSATSTIAEVPVPDSAYGVERAPKHPCPSRNRAPLFTTLFSGSPVLTPVLRSRVWPLLAPQAAALWYLRSNLSSRWHSTVAGAMPARGRAFVL